MNQTSAKGQALDLGSALKALVSDGLLSQADANKIAVDHRSREEALLHPLQYIANKQLCHAQTQSPLCLDTLTQWLAKKSKLGLANIDPLKINVPAVTGVMSFAYAQRYGILCIEVRPQEIIVATMQPFDQSWIESLEQTSRRSVSTVVANPADIKKYTLEFYSLAKSVFGAGSSSSGGAGISNFEQLLEVGKLKDPDAQDQHIVNIVDWLLQYAFEQRASDIHLEPRRDKGKVRFRIDGVLHLVYELPGNVMTAMTSRLKILGRMDVAEKRRPQDGRIKTVAPNASEVELRLSTMPTGSGKTTTLYSTLKHLAVESVNVSTIEDPIEMVVDAFNQSQIQSAIDFDFAAGIRTLMRQDPDIIMVGEIRDHETAEMAVQAALTGHLVLSTLHTNDAPTAISRLLDLGLPTHLLKATLNGVMAQRLVRTLCTACRKETASDAETWAELTRPFATPMPKTIYQPGGCLECRNTGYAGRQGVYEIMPLTNALLSEISADTDIQQIRQAAVKQGMKPLRLAGAAKVAEGITSIEEVMRVTPELGR
jgi:general secretion pathway protein E